MNFLGFPFLYALPLIALPVAIHLYRGRQREVIHWGAMQFLTQATTKGRSVQKLEELLLLLLRVAVVLALVLALAQPKLSSTWLGTESNSEVILVLDNSLSTARTVDDVSTNELLVEKALEFIDELSPSDTVHVLLATDGGQWLTARGLPADAIGKQHLTTLLEEMQPTLGTARWLGCLQSAVNLDPQDNPSSRRIVVFSDSQTQGWQFDSEDAWQQLGAARKNSPVPISIEVITSEVTANDMHNLAMMELETSRQLTRPDEKVELTARIANVGDTNTDATLVEWLVDAKVFHTSDLRALAPQESAQLTAPFSHEEAGNYAVTCRIRAEDQIILDNETSVVVEVSDQLPILIVHDFDDANFDDNKFTKSASELFSAALGYANGQTQRWHSIYRPELISTSELAETSLSKYRAIVMLNLSELPADSQQRLHAFVRAGGGLWVALGDMIDRDSFNRFWYDDGGGLSPISLQTLVNVADTNSPAGSIHPPERNHPATMALANTTQLDIDEARLSEYWQLVHNDSNSQEFGSQDENAERDLWVLLESGDGSPLVVENLIGEGRVLIQAFPLGLEWTNLPQLKSYVVMIHDWLDYLTAPAMARYNLKPGSSIVAPLADTAAGSTTAQLITPTGQEVALTTIGNDNGGLIRYSHTQLPGLYQLTLEANNETQNLPFFVARDTNESKWSPLASEQRTQLADLAGLQFEGETSSSTTTTAITNTEPRPSSKPIWGAILLALVGLLIGEQLLANWLARGRRGKAVTI